MLLVIPVSSSDQKLIPSFIKGFENFHPGSGHKLLVVGNPSIEETVRSVEATLAKYFSSTANFITSTDNRNGWPMAMNYLFYETSRHILTNYTPEDAFLWMEVDSTPLKQNWLTTISTTYFSDPVTAHAENRQPRIYLGAEVITRETRNGEVLPESETGTHMAAVGVYPQDVAARVKMLNVTPNIQKAFYEYIQWYTVPNMIKSNLIQHNWMTINYRKENGPEILSDSVTRFAYLVDYNTPVSSDAVLLHGVKDGSLQALLGGKELPQLAVAPPKIEPEVAEAVSPENEMVEVLTRDPSTGRITGEYISRKELEAREQEDLRIAEMRLKHELPILPEIAPEPAVETIPEPVVETISQDSITIGDPADLYPVEEYTTEGTGPVLLNNNQDSPAKAEPEEKPFKFVPAKRGRGPGRPKKIKREISDEERQRRADKMREVAKIAHKLRAEKKAALEAKQAN